MTVGTDTYITLSDTNAYITANMTAADPDRVRWESLIESDREIYLKRACEAIDRLPLHGRTVNINQQLAFPRLPYQRFNADGAPDDVIKAQIIIALWMSDTESRQQEKKQQELKLQGVTSVSMGTLSMGFTDDNSKTVYAAIMCPEAKELLNKYLTGGY